jgi:uncharacterized membrane protein
LPPPEAPAPTSRPRIAALDAARALAVVAMVVGHTLDALLSHALRQDPSVILYWHARGLTAPMFLAVSGWAVAVAILRSGAEGAAVVRGRLGRVLLLLAVGYALRWPGWGIAGLAAGDRAVWEHLLAFDALHAIAVALLATAGVLALPWRRREQVLLLALLSAIALALGMADPVSWPLWAVPLQQTVGGTSPFPAFPWVLYFFFGAGLGLVAGEGRGRRGLAMAVLGAVLVAATLPSGVGGLPPAHPVLVAFRLGAVLLLLAALARVPGPLAARLAPLGRASLWVYAIHLPVVYGWSTYAGLAGRIGPRLDLAEAAGVALLVLLASFALARALGAALGRARQLAALERLARKSAARASAQ